ncbi:hypothetical protein RND81_06G250900 [Saponaria officinalis]|uniref:RING-type E3 ubiquitin transferase n=1 Tax=Saponaria officinalis TaxID=3572 RepID=A0AAW1KG55_SAPOF
MTGRLEDPITQNPNLYPEELQIKLYQAFIFSIPILFCIILFLLFYLFYLKRRANNIALQNPRTQHSSVNHPAHSPPWNLGVKGELKDKLQVVLFDEELKARDSQCCVCLGEFEMTEELRQLPLCKHVFHGDCIRHWLRTNATCPLCRCPLISVIKMGLPIGHRPNPTHQVHNNPPHQEAVQGSDTQNSSRSEEQVIQIVE